MRKTIVQEHQSYFVQKPAQKTPNIREMQKPAQKTPNIREIR